MAVPVWPGTSAFGPFAVDTADRESIAEIYIYAMGISDGEMASLIGRRDKTGGLVDGTFTDLLQTLTGTASVASIDDLTAAAVELDADTSSPYFGFVRLVLAVTAAVDT